MERFENWLEAQQKSEKSEIIDPSVSMFDIDSKLTKKQKSLLMRQTMEPGTLTAEEEDEAKEILRRSFEQLVAELKKAGKPLPDWLRSKE